MTQNNWEEELRERWQRSHGITTIDFIIQEIAKAREDERKRMRLTNKQWIQILKTAIDSRPTSWVKNPVIEWRNAADELMLAYNEAISQTESNII